MSVIDEMVKRLEEFYVTNTIYKACVICSSDLETRALAVALDAKHHTVGAITECMIDDERPWYMEVMRNFRDGHTRMLVVTYSAWSRIEADFEVYVLPEQTLIAFGDLDDGVIDYVERRIGDAAMRGFLREGDPGFLLPLVTNTSNTTTTTPEVHAEDYLHSE